MNRSKIEWCDHTWNPITGCLHNCEYCYARQMTKRFCGDVRMNKMAKSDYSVCASANGTKEIYILDEPMLNEKEKIITYPFGFEPTLHRYRYGALQKLKRGNNIFVGAMSDVFGDWVPDDWLDEIFEICRKQSIHNYLFLTKNVERYTEYGVPSGMENMWYGTTITCEQDVYKFNYLPAFCKTFVSIEPLLDDIKPENCNIMFQQINWIIIGAETGGRRNKVVPQIEWIRKIVDEADKNKVPVFMKDSLLSIVGEKNMRREFPKQLMHKKESPALRRKLYDKCCECGKEAKKSEMVTLLAKFERKQHPKQYGFMCQNCFDNFRKNKKLELPIIEKRED